jgi:hypothetical protein
MLVGYDDGGQAGRVGMVLGGPEYAGHALDENGVGRVAARWWCSCWDVVQRAEIGTGEGDRGRSEVFGEVAW